MNTYTHGPGIRHRVVPIIGTGDLWEVREFRQHRATGNVLAVGQDAEALVTLCALLNCGLTLREAVRLVEGA